MWNQEKYQKAISFAGYAHRNQLVPGTEYSYVVHISNVAAEIARAVCADDVGNADLAMQCALLHDVIEDTDVTSDMIKKEFGDEVCEGVMALTKNPALDKEQAMADSLKRIKEKGREIACVKMADRITNLQSPPVHWDKTKKEKYAAEAMMIYKELHVFSDFLGKRLLSKIEEYSKYF